MNKLRVRRGLIIVSLLVGFSQPVLSAALKFVDGDNKEVPCGTVDKLTVTSTQVTAKGTVSCLNVSSTGTPTAAPQNLGSVDTGNSTTQKNITANAVVKLPLSAVVKVSGPTLPGASVTINRSTGATIYYAPRADEITGSANDYFTYTIKDATGKTSNTARVDVSVNWVDVPSDGCKAGGGIVCMGPTPDWPDFHEPVNHQLAANTTHVWSFTYDPVATGQIGAVLSTGAKIFKISETAGDTKETGLDCWRDFAEYVYYEPATGSDPGACDLTKGTQYYFNIRNIGANTQYQLKGYDDR